jgi:hypothetical protein
MATLGTKTPNLIDLAKRTDPEGRIDSVVEILNKVNEIIDDADFIECNDGSSHLTTVRTGIPAPTWRKLYGGVQPVKSTTAQVRDNTGMMENYAEVDAALAELNGNTAEFRLSENTPILQGMSEEFVDTLFYGNEGTEPEAFTGLSPRYNSVSSATSQTADNVIDAGGTGTDNASVWLVVWGPNTIHCLFPKGSNRGLKMTDKGLVTIEDASDGSNTGRMEAYRTHYRWDVGLSVRDWRYAVRIANVDKSDLTKDAATGADLIDLMTQALELLPSGGLGMGRAGFYANRKIRGFLRRQAVNKVKSSTLGMDEIGGRRVLVIDGVPIRRCDALNADEARVV